MSLFKIDPSDHRESVIQFQSQEQPVLEDRPKLTLAVPERAREGDHTETNGDAPRVGAVFQLLILGLVQGSVDVFAENSLSAHNVSILQLPENSGSSGLPWLRRG